jgi:chromosome segregation ATPase
VNKAEELDKLDKEIKTAETSQKSIQTNIDQLSKEINILNKQKIELEQNLEFHKRVGVIPLAHEYGKSKRELTKVTNRLNLITSDHSKSVQGLDRVKEIIVKFRRDYMRLLNSNEDNVVRAIFGVKRGKK